MKYLQKDSLSPIITDALSYSDKGQRPRIRMLLVTEQRGFCAYSERHINNTDSVDIEHFDGRLKDTEKDNYYNWYAVLTWLNSHKPKSIEPFLPILLPYSDKLSSRITYFDGVFSTVIENDNEAENLINYLGLNKPELYNDRVNHIRRLKSLLSFFDNDFEKFKDYLKAHNEELSFVTALEFEFEINFQDLITPLNTQRTFHSL